MRKSPDYDLNKAKLAELIESTLAFEYYPEARTLASGRKSNFYFDLKRLNGNPKGINTVAKTLYELIKRFDGIKSVGGLESGSISIATAISQISYIENPNNPQKWLQSFYVRKEPKKYGTKRQIEGCIESPVVIVEDVITSGMSAISAINSVRDAGFLCKCLLSVVFRGAEKDKENILNQISDFQFIFHERDFTSKYKVDPLQA